MIGADAHKNLNISPTKKDTAMNVACPFFVSVQKRRYFIGAAA